MSNIKVVLNNDSAAWSAVFLNSGEIRAGLEQYASAAAARSTAELHSSGSKKLKPEHAFVAVIDKADKSMLGKVVANSGEAKRVAIEAGLPHW